MPKKTMLIVNPVSGKGRVKNYLLGIITALSAGGEPTTVFVTEKQGDATEFAAKYGSEYERIACTGGDGTLNEVISGLMQLPEENRPIIGYVPLGTTNDMATSLNIPKTPKGAIARLEDDFSFNDSVSIDIGRLGNNYFGYVAAFGVFTDIPFTTPQAAKNTWGYIAYIAEAVGQLNKITSQHARITYDGGFLEDDYLLGFVTNSLSVAGIVKFPEENVALDDGMFEILLVKKPRNAADLSECVSNILSRNFNTERVTLLHTKKIRFDFDNEVQWTRDGENGGKYQSVEAINYHKAIKIFV